MIEIPFASLRVGAPNSRRSPFVSRAILAMSIALFLGPAAAGAEEIRLVIQRSPLAGFTHHAAKELWAEMREGDPLRLVAESDNPYDPYAIRVDWHERKIGYLPRSANGAIATAKARETNIRARISRLRDHPDPRRRIEIEVYAVLGASDWRSSPP